MNPNPKTIQTLAHRRLVRAIRDGFRTGKTYRAACGLLGAGLLGLAASGAAQADFPAVIELADLDGSNGFALNGDGGPVSDAGDVNGDGIDDLVVGGFVVFGGPGVGRGGVLELSALDGRNGFALNGINAEDRSGHSVSGAGDVNGDGVADLIIGAPYADPNGDRSGHSYVVFGGPGVGSSGVLELSALDGTNGFALNGIDARDEAGYSVSGAGDVNGDGVADLVVGADRADLFGGRTGQSYVVFGGPGVGRGGVLELSALDGTNGFALNGIEAEDSFGRSVSGAGDINDDGVDDLIIGAPLAARLHGQSYVVFGGPGVGRGGVLELSALDGANGFTLNGADEYSMSGRSVSSAGDINGDGVDDLVIGAPFLFRYYNGGSYVVFGGAGVGSSGVLELSALDGGNGFDVNGDNFYDRLGWSVSHAGDINGDGFDDVIISAPHADPNGVFSAGQSYVVFGRAMFTDGVLNVSDLDGRNGFTVNGFNASGWSVSGAGDVNGDGVDDVIISGSGQSYVVFGRQTDLGPWLTFAALRDLGDTNGDGTPEIAVVARTGNRNLATVTDAANGTQVSQIEFSAELRPVDLEVMDVFGFNHGYGLAPNLVLLGDGPAEAETRDALTGDLLGRIALDTTFPAVDLSVLPEQDGQSSQVLAILTTGSTAVATADGPTERVSVDSGGGQLVYGGTRPAISADGQLVAFETYDPILFITQVSVHNRLSGTTTLVSTDSIGTAANSDSGYPAISADGRFVAFHSNATNLVPDDINGASDIFVHERETGATERVSVDSNGAQANGYSRDPTINADGRFVAFVSYASNLVPGDANRVGDVFVRDRVTGATELVSIGSSGSSKSSVGPAISADGRFIAFFSFGPLAPEDTNDNLDVYVYDREAGLTELVSGGFNSGNNPAISGDGRFVAFVGGSQVFVHDRMTGATELASADSSGIEGNDLSGEERLAISAEGRFVAFVSRATNLVPNDTNNRRDIFVHDRATGNTERASVDSTGGESNGSSGFPAINADGRYVAFDSYADNLVSGDTSGNMDIFVHHRKTGTKVEILDAASGDPVNDLWFAERFEPRQVITLPDLNGNGSAEVGAVLTKADEPDRVIIKDSLTDEKIQTLMPWAPQYGFNLLQALPVPDADGHPTGKVALLLHEAATGKTLVRVTDVLTNAQLAMVRGFNASFAPVKLAAVPDLNGNGSEEYALLARDPDTGQVTVKVHDGATSERLSGLWFGTECTPLDLATIADINANGAEELVMLGRCGDEGQLRAFVKDARTAELLNRMNF